MGCSVSSSAPFRGGGESQVRRAEGLIRTKAVFSQLHTFSFQRCEAIKYLSFRKRLGMDGKRRTQN